MIRKIFNNVERDCVKSNHRLKIIFQFLLTAVFAFIIGALLFGACSDTFIAIAQNNINAHFDGLFFGALGFQDIVLTISIYTIPYIFFIVAIAFLSFSVFSYLVSDIAIFICGLKIGFSITLFLNCLYLGSEFENINILNFVLFSVFRIILFATLLLYAYRSALFSHSISYKNTKDHLYLEKLNVISFTAITAAYICALIIINGTYCALTYVLK